MFIHKVKFKWNLGNYDDEEEEGWEDLRYKSEVQVGERVSLRKCGAREQSGQEGGSVLQVEDEATSKGPE